MKKKKKSCRFNLFMDFEKYRGTEVCKAKAEIEGKGYIVTVTSCTRIQNAEALDLVIRAKKTGGNHVEIISGSFNFLTKGDLK